MDIYRNGLVFTLTDEELEQAYREQKRNYLLMDAEEQFKEYLRIHFDAIFVEDADAQFLQKYGFAASDVVDKDSDHYRLDAFADEYERRYDCNDAENDIWAEIITTFLEEQAQTSAIRSGKQNNIPREVLMDAKFRILRKMEDGNYEGVEEEYIYCLSPGGFTFMFDGKALTVDWNDSIVYMIGDGNKVYHYMSGEKEMRVLCPVEDQLDFLGISINDVTGKFLASADEIEEFFIYFDDECLTEQEAGNIYDNSRADVPYKVELVSITFKDRGDPTEYHVADRVIDHFNKGGLRHEV